MKPILFIPAALLSGCILAACTGSAPGSKMEKGAIESHKGFSSQFIAPRNVDVYLPPGYAEDTDKRYPVLYMHDGQNLFTPGNAFGGAEWQVDYEPYQLMMDEKMKEAQSSQAVAPQPSRIEFGTGLAPPRLRVKFRPTRAT